MHLLANNINFFSTKNQQSCYVLLIFSCTRVLHTVHCALSKIFRFLSVGRLNTSFFDDQIFSLFTPTFVQDVVQNATNETKTLCKGNNHCIFDVVVTGDNDAGVETLEVMERNEQKYNDLGKNSFPCNLSYSTSSITKTVCVFVGDSWTAGNFPPQILVIQDVPNIPFPNVIPVVTNGTAVNFNVTITDVNGDNFTTSFDTYPPNLLSTNKNVSDDGFGNYSFSWSIGDPTDLRISIISKDDDDAVSQVQLQVLKQTIVPLSLPSCPLFVRSFFPFHLFLMIVYIHDNNASHCW